MRTFGLAAALLCVAAHAVAQSHEPASKAGASSPSAATAHAPTARGEETQAAQTHDGDQKPAEAKRKGPTVSRVSMPPKAPAENPPALRPEPPDRHAAATKASGGYEATGGRPKSGAPALVAEKSKPVVSGAQHMAAKPAPAAEHGTVPAPHGAPGTAAHGAAPATTAQDTPAAVSAAVVKAPAAKGPIKLATVHGRLAAALAEFRPEPHGDERDGDAHGVGGWHAKGAESARPRIALTWPKARWRVEWPDADRVMVAWPE